MKKIDHLHSKTFKKNFTKYRENSEKMLT